MLKYGKEFFFMRLFLDKHLQKKRTYKEISDIAGIYPSTLYRWLEGKHYPNVYSLKLICIALERVTGTNRNELIIDYFTNHVE